MDAIEKQKFRIEIHFKTFNEMTNKFHPLPNKTEILYQLGLC